MNNKNAFIFFGQVKNYNITQHEQFVKYVSSAYSDSSIDYYLITTKSNKYYSSRQKENNNIDYNSMNKFFNFKNIIYDDIPNKIEEFKEFANYLVNNLQFAPWGKDSLNSTINSLKQIYSLNYFYNWFSNKYTEYTNFIMARSDLFYTSKLILPNPIEQNSIYVPSWGHYSPYKRTGGCNDRFCILTGRDVLKIYCERYANLRLNPEKYHAEQYLQNTLIKNNIKYKQLNNFNFSLIRSNNKIYSMCGRHIDEKLTKLYYN